MLRSEAESDSTGFPESPQQSLEHRGRLSQVRLAFAGRPGTPSIAIAIAVAAPLLLFLAGLRLSPSFRQFVLSLDLQLIAGVQAWRWAGLGVIFLYAYHVLPAAFALTAGLGDMAIGFTAPRMSVALARQPGFAARAAFVRWNALGILRPFHGRRVRNLERHVEHGRSRGDHRRPDGGAAAPPDSGILRAPYSSCCTSWR